MSDGRPPTPVGSDHHDGEGPGVQPLTSDDPAAIGGYRLQARLGAGGMGRVYLAATRAGRPVALKAVRSELSDDPHFRARFRREIQAAQRVHGLYTAQLVDADPDATPPWLVTAYVPGPSLEEAIDQHGPMPEAMVFRLIAGVAEALAAIHAAEVVHRDLKPSNVLLAHHGPRVIDFGIATARAAAALTRSDVMMGSPDFLAPEQVLDLAITPAMDVFALGSLAVYAAVGRPPFGAGNVAAVAHRVVYEPPDLAGCPANLLTLIESCLEKQAKDRPAPSRIIEYCVARATEPSDASQPWLAWGPAAAAAEAGRTESERLATAQTVKLAGAALAGRRRPRLVATLAAAALAAAAVIAIVVSSQHAPAGTAGLRNTAARGVTTPAAPASGSAPAVTGASARASAPAVTRASASAPAAASASPARSRVAVPAPAGPVALLSQDYPVAASSVQGYPWAAAYAVDGNLGTRWSSAWSDPQWLAVDLRATHSIRKVLLYWENAYATAFQIQVSANGTTWTDLYSTTTGTGGTQSITVSGAGRYVRMYGTRRNTGYGYSLWEFQVFGN